MATTNAVDDFASSYEQRAPLDAQEQLKDSIAGTVAGTIVKVVEYPFDTLKVRFQLEKVHVSTASYFRNFIRQEGILSIFRGLPAPMFGSAVENLITFWMFGMGERVIKQVTGKNTLNSFEVGLAGAYAGIGIGVWLTPVEWVKIRMQASTGMVGSQTHGVKYRNSWHCLAHTLRTDPIRMMDGLFSTLLREVPGTFIWFVGYHQCVWAIYPDAWGIDPDLKNAPWWVSFAGGAWSGVVYWVSIYPVDLAKSRLQAGLLDEGKTIRSILRYRLGMYGFASWYSGLAVTLPRGVLSNAIIFGAVDQTKNLLDKFVFSSH